MKIGLGIKKITPELPVLMAGYEGERKADGILDDLYAKVLLIEKQREKEIFGIISFDLVGVDHLIIDRLEEKMNELGLDRNHFIISATHTHSGPGGILDTRGDLKGMKEVFGYSNRKTIAGIVRNTVAALKEALEDLSAGKIYYANDQLEGIGTNRNEEGLSGKDDLFLLYIEKENGRKAVVIHFACHPTILNALNSKISGDFPGVIQNKLTKKGYDISFFLNGSGGDISTRFTRKEPTYEEVLRMAELFQDKIIENRDRARWAGEFSIESKRIFFPMKVKKPEKLSDAHENLFYYRKKAEEALEKGITGGELRKIESNYEGARANLHYAENPIQKEEVVLLIGFVSVDDHYFITIPGELFSELGRKIENEKVHIIGYANGYIGYIADERAYTNRTYEALSSPFEKGEGEKLVDFIEKMIEEGR